MGPRAEKSNLKRARNSTADDQDSKKPRRSERISSQAQNEASPQSAKTANLPSPLTNNNSTATEPSKEQTVSPAGYRASQQRAVTPVSPAAHRAGQKRAGTPISSQQLSSPPIETQSLSQFVYPPRKAEHDLDDDDDATWGYLFSMDSNHKHKLALKHRSSCPSSSKPLEVSRHSVKSKRHKKKDELVNAELAYEKDRLAAGSHSGGYLIGRHPECDVIVDTPTVSNRHCIIFNESRDGSTVAIVEDLSSNGTFVNDQILGRNKRRELEDGDEVTILDEARFVFRYPSKRHASGFHSQYRILQQLGKGHFATVYLCVQRSSGFKFAVKKFEKRLGESQRSQTEGLQQEIAMLMSVSHPNVLCLKDTFDEHDGVYLVLELAAEGELFNWIITKQKLSEAETRKVFIQLFQGTKYLHERNIVHRDIKPENVLLTDKNLSVKLADFGLAKIIGEESFTTTLCGTPCYVAPEILQNSRHRKYTKAVDIWSLGVVLYICLCGFPPFSDELYTNQNPYTMAQQIKLGRFDYPSPYWDSIGDPALDLIDRMLTVDVRRRLTIDECLEHPWTRDAGYPSLADSTDGLTGAMGSLDFSRRKLERERTLLADMNDVKVSQAVDLEPTNHKGRSGADAESASTKTWVKNTGKAAGVDSNKEPHPAGNRQESEFMQMGGKGDMPLFADDLR
ncbi:hypothetical protein DV735_g1177, partial [Chaetothyriales sp. CBS 134920]